MRLAGVPPERMWISCSWCNELNDVTEDSCGKCGHDNKPRMQCRCGNTETGCGNVVFPIGPGISGPGALTPPENRPQE